LEKKSKVKAKQKNSVANIKKPKKKNNKRGNPEYLIQCDIIEWFRKTYPNWIIFSTNNEACFSRKEKYKKSGLLSGLSDLVIVTDKETVFIECKSLTGRCSKEQKEFQQKLTELNHKTYVVRSIEAFMAIVNTL
jgi:hypothetical protein